MATGLLIAAAACRGLTDESPPAHAIVYGRVTTEAGEPVSGAAMRIYALAHCDDPGEFPSFGIADAAGNYRNVLTGGSVPCIRVVAVATRSGITDSVTATGGPLAFNRSRTAEYDSIRIDLHFP